VKVKNFIEPTRTSASLIANLVYIKGSRPTLQSFFSTAEQQRPPLVLVDATTHNNCFHQLFPSFVFFLLRNNRDQRHLDVNRGICLPLLSPPPRLCQVALLSTKNASAEFGPRAGARTRPPLHNPRKHSPFSIRVMTMLWFANSSLARRQPLESNPLWSIWPMIVSNSDLHIL